MKKFCLLILVSVLLISCAGCRQSPSMQATESEKSQEEKETSEIDFHSIEESTEALGSGEDYWNAMMTWGGTIPGEIAAIVGDEARVDAWLNNFETWGGTRKGGFSLWLFVHEFDLSREEIEAWNESIRQRVPEVKEWYTEEELDMIFDEDPTAFYEHFSNPCAVVVGTVIYSPEWLYEHTVSEWKEAGITAEQVKIALANMEKYVEKEILYLIPDPDNDPDKTVFDILKEKADSLE